MGFPDGSDSKESACNVGDPSLIPGSGRSPSEGNGNPLQYSRLENSVDRGAWRATVHGVTKNRTQLSDKHTSNQDTKQYIHMCVCVCVCVYTHSHVYLKIDWEHRIYYKYCKYCK